jgi:hypothetical protein
MLRRRVLKLLAALRKEPVFTDSRKSRHKTLPNSWECGIMTMTLVWTGVALWLALNAGVAGCLLVVQPGRTTHRLIAVRIWFEPWTA